MTTYTAPACSGPVDIFLDGTRYTAPNYPNCPSETAHRKVGQCAGGQTLELVETTYYAGCSNASFVNVTGITNNATDQWQTGSTSLSFVCNPDLTKYDCLNGDCIDQAKYKTPGIYNSLVDCQKVCGTGGSCGNGKICIDPNSYCPDGKACLDQSEVSQINSLLSKVKGDIC